MVKENKISVVGASGKTYKFNVYPWGQSFKPVGGVYLVLKANGSQQPYNLIYVGQTVDLDERFNDHHKQDCFDRYGKTHIAVRAESVEQSRLAIESDLIKKHQPVCNG